MAMTPKVTVTVRNNFIVQYVTPPFISEDSGPSKYSVYLLKNMNIVSPDSLAGLKSLRKCDEVKGQGNIGPTTHDFEHVNVRNPSDLTQSNLDSRLSG